MASPDLLDFDFLRQGYRAGNFSPQEVVAEVSRRIERRGQDAVWIDRLTPGELADHAGRIEGWKKEGRELPLYGQPFAIKDNIDLAGHPTTAACPEFAYTPSESAAAVRRLLEAGAIPVGKTNLDQFATGLNGTRSPYGAPRCVFDERYISGGSSSGSAVAVAAGLVSFSLGTDTAGSGRVPAAFNELIGLKPTRGRVSTRGVVPACRSLDCVSIFTRSAAQAREILQVVEGPEPGDPWSRAISQPPAVFPAEFRFGVPFDHQLEFFGDTAAAALYDRALSRLEKMGGRRVGIDYAPFLDTARLLYHGPWVAERMAAIRSFYASHADAIEPTVRAIISGADKFSAVDAFDGLYRLQALRQQALEAWGEIDFLALPTAGTIYTVEQLLADPIQLNTNLGYYTNFMNLLDLSGIALPAGRRPNGLPFGITLAAPAHADLALCDLGEKWQASPL